MGKGNDCDNFEEQFLAMVLPARNAHLENTLRMLVSNFDEYVTRYVRRKVSLANFVAHANIHSTFARNNIAWMVQHGYIVDGDVVITPLVQLQLRNTHLHYWIAVILMDGGNFKCELEKRMLVDGPESNCYVAYRNAYEAHFANYDADDIIEKCNTNIGVPVPRDYVLVE